MARSVVDACSKDPEQLLAIGAAGREMARERFSIEKVSRRYLELFSGLVG